MAPLRRLNLETAQTEPDATDPPGYRSAMNRFGPSIGARRLGGSVYDIPPGQSICPYHYEWGDEEWLIVLEGIATVRHPEGEEDLARGDVACFPPGPDGAHKVTNTTEEPLRVLMVSTLDEVGVAVYPDSDKVGVYPAGATEGRLFRQGTAVDYWDGEA